MRPSFIFALILTFFIILDLSFMSRVFHSETQQVLIEHDLLTESLGLSDLCLSTEARYTRHLSVTDHTAPFMDHPGAMEHFPSGSFYRSLQ